MIVVSRGFDTTGEEGNTLCHTAGIYQHLDYHGSLYWNSSTTTTLTKTHAIPKIGTTITRASKGTYKEDWKARRGKGKLGSGSSFERGYTHIIMFIVLFRIALYIATKARR